MIKGVSGHINHTEKREKFAFETNKHQKKNLKKRNKKI